jgi:hypothetical protein
MKKKIGKLCYFCGSAATSGEHVPPRQMFKGFDCDSLVVPSCNDHNSMKSNRNQAVISALLTPLHLGNPKNLKPEIIKAINFALPSFERAKRLAVRTPLLIDPPTELKALPELAHLDPSVLLTTWIRQLTAGILYSGIGSESRSIKWAETHVWSPNWFPHEKPIPVDLAEYIKTITPKKNLQILFDSLPWQSGWSSSPKPYPSIIYSFMIVIHSDELITLRHKFYEQYNWYVTFHGTKNSIELLQKKVLEV